MIARIKAKSNPLIQEFGDIKTISGVIFAYKLLGILGNKSGGTHFNNSKYKICSNILNDGQRNSFWWRREWRYTHPEVGHWFIEMNREKELGECNPNYSRLISSSRLRKFT